MTTTVWVWNTTSSRQAGFRRIHIAHHYKHWTNRHDSSYSFKKVRDRLFLVFVEIGSTSVRAWRGDESLNLYFIPDNITDKFDTHQPVLLKSWLLSLKTNIQYSSALRLFKTLLCCLCAHKYLNTHLCDWLTILQSCPCSYFEHRDRSSVYNGDCTKLHKEQLQSWNSKGTICPSLSGM